MFTSGTYNDFGGGYPADGNKNNTSNHYMGGGDIYTQYMNMMDDNSINNLITTTGDSIAIILNEKEKKPTT